MPRPQAQAQPGQNPIRPGQQPPVAPGQPLPPPTPPGALQTSHHPSQKKKKEGEELEFMDELPDIM
jgi:hypothetical protein